jgi:hypothetical protein
MPRRTPLEVIIAQQTDRQAQYEKRKRDAGFTKACVWVPTDRVAELKTLARNWVSEAEAAADPPASDPR